VTVVSIQDTATAARSGGVDPGSFLTPDGDSLIPGPMAQGPWGPTLGGHIVGGALARAVEAVVEDPELQPARFTVDVPRRVPMLVGTYGSNPGVGLAANGQFSSDGVASGTATIVDERGPGGTGLAVALAQPAGAFNPPRLSF
jgi:hypothetical protein